LFIFAPTPLSRKTQADNVFFHVAGTNPIHNKKPKKAKKEEDDDDIAFKAKQAAGSSFLDAAPLLQL
jgi:hypothetical protein